MSVKRTRLTGFNFDFASNSIISHSTPPHSFLSLGIQAWPVSSFRTRTANDQTLLFPHHLRMVKTSLPPLLNHHPSTVRDLVPSQTRTRNLLHPALLSLTRPSPPRNPSLPLPSLSTLQLALKSKPSSPKSFTSSNYNPKVSKVLQVASN